MEDPQSISRLYELAAKVGSNICGFQLSGFSITGDDYDRLLHGYVYKSILRESSVIRIWNPPPGFAENPGFSGFSKVAPKCYEAESSSGLSIDNFVPLINMSKWHRGSLAFALPSGSQSILAEIVAKAELFGPFSSVSEAMKGHIKSSWAWARKMSQEGFNVILLGSQWAPKHFELFPSHGDSTDLIDRLRKLNPELFRWYGPEDNW